MTIKMYAIKDRTANEFGPVQMCKNDAVALRMFQTSIKNTEYPEDFTLYNLGEMNVESGEIQPYLFVTEINVDSEVEDDE